MNEENKLAYPKKIDINSFPKEKKRHRRKKRFRFFRNLRSDYDEWRQERRTRKAKNHRNRPGFGDRLLIFLLGPIADFIDDLRRERELRKTLKIDRRPNIFQRLYWMYLENKEMKNEEKVLNRKIRKAMSFDFNEDRHVFSFKDEINNIKSVWKNLPWKKSRELENMTIASLTILITFVINYMFIQGGKFLVATLFGIPAVWRNMQTEFNIPDPSPLWTYGSVLSVYSVGPFLLFITGMISLRFHALSKDKSSFAALFHLWMYLNAFNLFFGTFIAGIFTDRGFGYLMGWLFIPRYIEVPLGLFSVFMIWMIGFSAGKKLIAFAPARQFYTSVLPQFFIKSLYVYIPISVSIGLLLLIGFNHRDFTIQLVYLTLLIMLTPTLRFIPERMT